MKNIHVLPTDKPSRLIIYSTLLNEFRLLDEPIEDWKHKRNIYITSDEEIKEGDWFMTDDRRIEKSAFDWQNREWHYKIILTTDQDLIKDGVQAIEEDFLNWFVKNQSCNKVEIQLDKVYNKNRDSISYYKTIIPKEDWLLNNPHCKQIESCSKSLSKKCICQKEEPKQETLEEVFNNEIKNKYNFTIKDISPSDKLDIGGNIIEDKHYFENDIEMTQCIREMAFNGRIPKRWSWFVAKISDLYKWQAERMYSEEEVLIIITEFKSFLSFGDEFNEIEWFEKIKNK